MKRSTSLGLAFLAVVACAWSLPSLAQSTGDPVKGWAAYKNLDINATSPIRALAHPGLPNAHPGTVSGGA